MKTEKKSESFFDEDTTVEMNGPHAMDSRGRTLLFRASAKGNTEMVAYLANQVTNFKKNLFEKNLFKSNSVIHD